MMPRKGWVDIVAFRSVVGSKFTSSFRDAPLGAGYDVQLHIIESILIIVVMDSGLSLREPRNDEHGSSSLPIPRRALFHVGADRLGLVRTAQQLLLLDRLGQQRRAGIDGEIIQHALGGADRVRAFAGDLAGDLKGCRARVVANPRGEPVTQGFLGRKNPPGPGQLAQNMVAATSASNMAASSAFILSARTSRTSAIPSEIDIETRCSMRIFLRSYSLLPLYRKAVVRF